MRDEELDREPAPGQWPIREALRHMVGAEYGFSAAVGLAMDAHARGEPLREPTDDEFAKAKAMPRPIAELVRGDRRAVANDVCEAHRRALTAMSRVTDRDLERPAMFWDGEMPLRFRLHRFEAHLRQHTIQVEKTLLGIGHPATEAERLVRLIHNALADVESATVGGMGEAERAQAGASIAARVADLTTAQMLPRG